MPLTIQGNASERLNTFNSGAVMKMDNLVGYMPKLSNKLKFKS